MAAQLASTPHGKKDNRPESKRQRPGSCDDDCSTFLCQKCDQTIREKITCTCCKLHYCIQCAKISAFLYQCIRNNELDDFHWTCGGCKTMFPTLENISETLGDIKVKHERRMSELESRMDSYETKNTEEIISSVASMKEDVLVDIKSDVNKLVDQRNKELEDRKRREMNLVIFNLNENTHESDHVNKQRDEEDFRTICSSLGLKPVELATTYRLGKASSKPRPLKVILTDRNQRKYLLANAKFIPEKTPLRFNKIIITKDLTPEQRSEKREAIKKWKAKGKPRKNTDNEQLSNANAGGSQTAHEAMDAQLGHVSPIPSQGHHLSQHHVFNESRPLESTQLPMHHYEASTIVGDRTVIGGVSQEDTLQLSPTMIRQ